MSTATGAPVSTDNALARFWPDIRAAADLAVADGQGPTTPGFAPPFALPELDDVLERLFGVSRLAVGEVGAYRDRPLRLLDLTGNPGTRTTKTLASSLMVGRAVTHIRATGEGILIVTPTSANKGTALRDAVLRAVTLGLVPADKLRVMTIAPSGARAKLWRSRLSDDLELRRLNPVAVYGGAEPGAVKHLARGFADTAADELERSHGLRLWHTLDVANYRVADSARAFFEAVAFPFDPDQPRLHVHAVSSAYGLLGYGLGRRVLQARGGGAVHPGFFLVQHLGTPDMVLSLRSGSCSRDGLPVYEAAGDDGLLVQDEDPRFPATTLDADEALDPTFYTHAPPTAAETERWIARHGGDGIVVSLHECLARYAEARALAARADLALPADPRRLREWALVMAITGALNAIDRGLIDDGTEVVIHASGLYTTDDFAPLGDDQVVPVEDVDDVRRLVLA